MVTVDFVAAQNSPFAVVSILTAGVSAVKRPFVPLLVVHWKIVYKNRCLEGGDTKIMSIIGRGAESA